MSDADKQKLQKPSGRVRHDSGGRAVWQWAVDSGRHAIDSTSRLLKKLDLSHLSILDDDEHPGTRPPAADAEPDKPIPTFGGQREVDPQAGSKQGFNPYDNRKSMGRGVTPAKPKPPAKPRITQPVRPPKPQGFLAKMFGGKK
jgi:hypothetical protein